MWVDMPLKPQDQSSCKGTLPDILEVFLPHCWDPEWALGRSLWAQVSHGVHMPTPHPHLMKIEAPSIPQFHFSS